MSFMNFQNKDNLEIKKIKTGSLLDSKVQELKESHLAVCFLNMQKQSPMLQIEKNEVLVKIEAISKKYDGIKSKEAVNEYMELIMKNNKATLEELKYR